MAGFGYGTRVRPRRAVAPAPGMSANPIAYGRTAGYDAGTAGDLFVDGRTGRDTNPGTGPDAPFKTVGKAVATALAATGTRVIRVMGDGVRYRERVFASWSTGNLTGLTIAAYGTDRPWISGAEVVSGFAQCTAADEAALGPNYGAIHKATVPASALAHGEYWRLMVAEAGEPLTLAAVREGTDAIPPFFVDATSPMFDTADTAGLTITRDASSYFRTISHPARLGAFTDAQLGGTVAALHVAGNYAGFVKVGSVAGGVLTLASNTFRPSAGNGAYALLNVLPKIERGGWAWRDNGDGTVTLFVWPRDPANLASGIEVSARKETLWIARSGATGRALTLDGLGFEMASSTLTDYSSACVFISGDGALLTMPTLIKQCDIRRFGGGQGLFVQFQNNFTCQDTTIAQGLGFGINCNPLADHGFNHRFERVLAEDLSQTGYRMLGVRNSVLVDCKAVRTSGGGHANSLNVYQNSDRVAVVRFIGSYRPGSRLYAGYATNQQSSRLLFLNCIWPMASDGRAFVDQSGGSSPLPGPASGDFWMINC